MVTIYNLKSNFQVILLFEADSPLKGNLTWLVYKKNFFFLILKQIYTVIQIQKFIY